MNMKINTGKVDWSEVEGCQVGQRNWVSEGEEGEKKRRPNGAPWL